MRKNLIGQIVITEEEQTEYKNLKTAVKDKDRKLKDRENVIITKNEKIAEQNSLIIGLEAKISSLASDIRAEFELELKDKDSKIEKLTKERNTYAARCGGYQKEQNSNHRTIDSLNEQLKIANERINNFSKQLQEAHVQVSPMQYDKRITTVAQHKKKLKKCK